MNVLRELWLFLHCSFELRILVREKPLKDCLLDLLVIFFFEELVLEKSHRAHDKQLSPLWAHVECGKGAVCGVAHWPGRKNRKTRLSYIQCGTIRVHKLQSTVLFSTCEIVFGISVTFSKFSLNI